jgi:ABC-2 type transport system ATP-binding protein
MGFIGANGSGKTTTIKLIMNLLRRTGGEIRVFGKEILEDEVEIKSRIGFVYDIPHFYDYLNLDQMKDIIAPFYKGWNDKEFYRYIDIFNLPLKKKLRALSRGMTMKYALAIALSHGAELIIMD